MSYEVAIKAILEGYPNNDNVAFTVTDGSAALNAVEVLEALLHHAINPSSVASSLWDDPFSLYFKDDVTLQYNPPRVLVDQGSVRNRLLLMDENNLDNLAEGMKDQARNWVTMFLLPGMLFSPAPL